MLHTSYPQAGLPARVAEYAEGWTRLEAKLRAAAAAAGAAPRVTYGDIPWPLRSLAALGRPPGAAAAAGAAGIAAAAGGGGGGGGGELRDLVLSGAT